VEKCAGDTAEEEDAMKAMLLTGFGGTDMLRYGDAPDPVAGPGDVLVDVHAASVNAADYKMRVGGYSSTLKFPHILGRDFSGVISALGAGVDDLAVGDAVFGVTIPGTEGAYAEKLARSEERRVGKECRSRWSTYH